MAPPTRPPSAIAREFNHWTPVDDYTLPDFEIDSALGNAANARIPTYDATDVDATDDAELPMEEVPFPVPPKVPVVNEDLARAQRQLQTAHRRARPHRFPVAVEGEGAGRRDAKKKPISIKTLCASAALLCAMLWQMKMDGDDYNRIMNQ